MNEDKNIQDDNVIEMPVGGTELMYSELKRRLPDYFDKYSIFNYPSQADLNKKLIYWNQLSYDQPSVQFLTEQSAIDQISAFVFVSHWQANKFRELYGIPGIKTHVIKNAGLGTPHRKITKKSPNDVIKICYTSTPWRGLDVLLDAWELLSLENVELHIFSSTVIYGSDFAMNEDSKYEPLYNRARNLTNVVYRGYVSNETLREELATFDILAYSNTFEETSCISVIDALSAGLRVVTSNLAVLPETTEGWARLYPFMPNKEVHSQRFSQILLEEVNCIRDGSLVSHLTRQMLHYSNYWSWDYREKDWIDFFNFLEN